MFPFACINRFRLHQPLRLPARESGRLTDFIERPVRQSVFAHASCFNSVLGCCAGGLSREGRDVIRKLTSQTVVSAVFVCRKRLRANPHGDPRGRVLRVHASGHLCLGKGAAELWAGSARPRPPKVFDAPTVQGAHKNRVLDRPIRDGALCCAIMLQSLLGWRRLSPPTLREHDSASTHQDKNDDGSKCFHRD